MSIMRRAVLLTLTPGIVLAACDWFAGTDPASATPVEGEAGVTAAPSEAGFDTGVQVVAPDGRALTDAASDTPDTQQPEGASAEDASCTACIYGCFDGACTAPFASLGGTSATTTTGNNTVSLVLTSQNGSSTGGGPAPHTSSVTVTTSTQPGGTCAGVVLVWSLDPTFATSQSIAMQLATSTSSKDTWSGVVPAQAAGAELNVYLVATPVSGSKAYDPSGFGIHYAYAVN
jgi:hypothetical protein